MPDFTIMSWNMNGNPDAWGRALELAESAGVQVALVQEAKPPTSPSIRTVPDTSEPWSIDAHRDVQRGFRTAVAVLDPDIRFASKVPVPFAEHRRGDFTASHPGQFAVIDVLDAENQIAFTAISLYGIWDQDERFLFAEGTLHRALSDLTVLFQDRNRTRIVLTGDFNIYRQWANSSIGGNWSPRYDTVFSRLEAYGLRFVGPTSAEPLPNCPCGGGAQCQHVRTFAYQRKATNRPYQLDYVFATDSVQVLDCGVISDETDWTFSDHLPVRATIRVP